MLSSLKKQFDNDKAFLLNHTKEFLTTSGVGVPLETNRAKIEEAVEKGSFTEALQGLEILRHAKTGIKLTKIEGKNGETSILIRDGRNNPNEKIVLGTEAFEMQYLNAIRGAIDIAKTENKPELVLKLNKEAVKFINSFNALNMEKSQENISKNMQTEINNIAELLGTNGIKNAHKKLNVAKDFQNFNDEHCNIVTLSKITNYEGKEHIVVEAEVAFKGLTKEQKQEYQNRESKNWYNVMPEWERKLVDQYADTIQNGRHVIPTQLRQIVGMKNAFEKIGAITDKDGKNFETLLTSKHAGTLASISNDIDSRQKITDLNARQAQEWLEDGVTIHTNTLNSGPIGAGNDPTIVDQTKKSMENVGGKDTNTPLNLFRLIGVTNNFSGVSDTLNKITENLLTEKGIDELKAHIKPRSKFEHFFRINKPKGNAAEIINNANLKDQEKEILKKAVTLRENIEQADIPFRISFETKFPFISFDKENINLNISDALSNLTEKIRQNKQENKTTSLINLPQEEILTMCASGKDREGLNEHNKISQAVSKYTGIKITDIDKQLLKNGHIAQQAGSIYAGGATIGCYGTKSENKAGIPKSRKETLAGIMEVTAKTNKIEDKKKMDKKIDAEYEKNHPKESIVIRSDKKVVKPLTTKSVSQLKPSITPPVKFNKSQNIGMEK